MKEAILNEHERHSAAWKKIEAYLHERQELLRKRIEKDISHDATNKLRGRLQENTNLLTQVEGIPGPAAEEANDTIE